jgi:putative transposase
LLVLRHQNQVLRRELTGRLRWDHAGRLWLAALSRLVNRRRWAEIVPVAPATIWRGHRHLAARKRTATGRRRPGRPSTGVSVKTLIVRLAPENPARCHSRIQGELARPGQAIAASGRSSTPLVSIRRTGPTGREFPAAQAHAIIARGFLAAETVPLQRSHVPAFIEPGTRRPGRSDRAPDRGTGGAAGPQPRHGLGGPTRPATVPDPPSRPGLHRRVRRGAQGSRTTHHHHFAEDASEERHLRAHHRDPPPRAAGPDLVDPRRAHPVSALHEYPIHHHGHRPHQPRRQRPPDIETPPVPDLADRRSARRTAAVTGLINEYHHAA